MASSVPEYFERKLKVTEEFEGKFSKNNFFIVANDEINASELEEHLVKKVKAKVFPKFTKFYLIGGLHHGKDPFTGNVKIGHVEFTLLQGFYHKVRLFQLRFLLAILNPYDFLENFRYFLDC